MVQSTALAFMSVAMVFGVIITRERHVNVIMMMMITIIMTMLKVLLMSRPGLGNKVAESIVMLACVMVRSKEDTILLLGFRHSLGYSYIA